MYSGVFIIQALVDFFVGLTEIILGLRIIFRLFAANPYSPFVHWIYTTSGQLMTPFRGIFPTEVIHPGGYALDVSALFAMIIYAFVGYVILSVIGWLPPANRRGYNFRRR